MYRKCIFASALLLKKYYQLCKDVRFCVISICTIMLFYVNLECNIICYIVLFFVCLNVTNISDFSAAYQAEYRNLMKYFAPHNNSNTISCI